jgi:DNA-binding NarL/FixJ family response regulator
LIVEDEPAIAQDIEMTLEAAQFEVVGIAGNSSKALELIHARKPDIVLLDIAIQGDQNGIDLGHLINREYKIPFVYLTAFSDLNTISEVKETFPYGYIVKPFKDKDLAPTLEIALARHQAFANTSLPDRDRINACIASPLTKAEYNVLDALWMGNDNNEISETLHISMNTVKSHIGKILMKLEVPSRSAAVAKVREVGRL